MSSQIPNAPIETSQTFSKAQPSIGQTPSCIVSSEYQTSSVKFSDLPYEPSTENPSNICSSSSCMNPSEARLLSNNENSIWVSSVDDAEDFGVQRVEENGLQAQMQMEKDKTCEKGIDEIIIREADKGNLETTNASFESSNFDFGLLESILTSELISNDLNYMDELAWNF